MLRISRIKLSEIPDAKRLLKTTWIDTYGRLYTKKSIEKITGVWHSKENLISQAKGKEFYFGVAKENKKIVGLVTVRNMNDGSVFLQRLYIHPKHQRKGVGKKLMNKALAYFNANKAMLEVEEKNGKAIDFYKKNGFMPVKKKNEDIEGQSIYVLLMEKKL
ncbi:MAG: GNAT family N-acetyltransferase [Candidatus Aenigmarchaeota archaeon]|nr:GNAT family N-acetyltransferase [Candidatus Aenigmarchaeota archaeon]